MYAITTETETLTTYKCCLSKHENFAGKFEQLVSSFVHACYLFEYKILNISALEKCTNGKAFYIVASVQITGCYHTVITMAKVIVQLNHVFSCASSN